jgi:hypothetical protein
MINVKKGPAHSLGQADIRGTAPTATQLSAATGTGVSSNTYTNGAPTTVIAGMLCRIDSTTGAVTPGGCGGTTNNGLRGFAINNLGDGDVIESQKIALYSLDGVSIIETDQVDITLDSVAAVSLTNYPVGTAIYQSTATAGLVSKTSTNAGNLIGYVEGVRYLQNSTPNPVVPLGGTGKSLTQNYTSATEAADYAASNAAGNTNFPAYTPSTGSATFKAQVNVPVLSIKLASTN